MKKHVILMSALSFVFISYVTNLHADVTEQAYPDNSGVLVRQSNLDMAQQLISQLASQSQEEVIDGLANLIAQKEEINTKIAIYEARLGLTPIDNNISNTEVNQQETSRVEIPSEWTTSSSQVLPNSSERTPDQSQAVADGMTLKLNGAPLAEVNHYREYYAELDHLKGGNLQLVYYFNIGYNSAPSPHKF